MGFARIVSPFPLETTSKGLEPGVEGDGDHENLPEGMKECAEVALAETMGESESKSENDKNFGPNQWSVGWGEDKDKGS